MITYYPELVADLRKIRNDAAKFTRQLLGRRDRNGEDHGVDEHAAQRSEAIRTRLSTVKNPLFFDKRNTPTQHTLDLIARWSSSYDAYEASGWDRSAIFDGSDCLHCVSRRLLIPNRTAFMNCEKCPGFFIADGQIVEKHAARMDTETAFEILTGCANLDEFYEKAAGVTFSECSRLLGVLSDRYTVTPYLYPGAEIEIKGGRS